MEVHVLLHVSTALSSGQPRGTNWKESLVSPRVDHDEKVKWEIPATSVVQHTDLASHYTNGAVLAHVK
jgi:hypothetical protein